MRFALPALLLLLAGCTPLVERGEGGDIRPVIGMANPASVSCVDNGGRSEIRDTPRGQIGVCVFHTGQVCEEWALFRDRRCVAP